MHEPAIKKILIKNHIDSNSPIRSFESGQINAVYQIGSDLVLKIEKKLDVTAHQPELLDLALSVGAKVPKAIDSGSIEGSTYLLMTKIPGRKLADDWLSLSQLVRASLIEQITDQLKRFHSIGFSAYAMPRPHQFKTWEEAVDSVTDWNSVDVGKLDEITKACFLSLKDFYFEHKSLLQHSSPPVLVHNDLHFENILHDNGTLTGIIDFDFARQAPKNHELEHILDFFCNPVYYVEEKLESEWKGFQVSEEIKLLQKNYPELFADPNLIPKLKVYFAETLIGDLADGAVAKFTEKFKKYFEEEWLEKHLL